MPRHAIAELSDRARRRLPPAGVIRAAFSCAVNDRDAALVLTHDKVIIVGRDHEFYAEAPLGSALLTPLEGLACKLEMWKTPRTVHFRSAADSQRALSEFSQAVSVAQMGSTRGKPLGPDDRLVGRCTYLGGVNVPVAVGADVDLVFRPGHIQVHRSPLTRDSTLIANLSYGTQFSIDLSGPGRFTTGGGFVGGGIGLEGAAQGMAIASVLNALTTRTRVESVIAVSDSQYEGFFLCRDQDLDRLRILLAPVFLRARQSEQRPVEPAATDAPGGLAFVEMLERLTALRQSGALSDDEFRQAKLKALGMAP